MACWENGLPGWDLVEILKHALTSRLYLVQKKTFSVGGALTRISIVGGWGGGVTWLAQLYLNRPTCKGSTIGRVLVGGPLVNGVV